MENSGFGVRKSVPHMGFQEIVSSTSGSGVLQGQDGLGRVWESEFWAENKGGSLISVFRVSYIHILKS